MKITIYLFIALFTITQTSAQKENFKIIGNFSNIKEADSIFICNRVKNKLVPFSKSELKKGSFKLKGHIPYEHTYYTMVTSKDKDTLYGQLFIEKRTLKYSGLFTKYPVFKVKGSKYAHKIYASHQDSEYIKLRKKVMDMESRETTDEEKIALQKLQQKLGGYIFNIDKSWFDKSHATHQLYVLYGIDPKKNFDEFEKQVKHFQANFSDHPEAMGIGFAYDYYTKNKENEAAGIVKKSRVGTKYIDVTSVDIDGKTHKLSKILEKNKLVLLDFWASWCSPCRAEFPHLRIAYNKHKENGFEIYAVSLDDSRKKWLKALNEEKTDWINAVDLKAWKSQSVKDYKIEGIPYNILVNSEGEILGESLRGKALEDLLEKHLNTQKVQD